VKHNFIDRYVSLDSPLHLLDARSKLLGFTALIIAVLWVPAGRIFIFFAYFFIVVIFLGISQIPLGYVVGRTPVLLPFVALAGLAVPALTAAGGAQFAALLLRSVLCFMVLILLTNTTRFGGLLRALRKMGCPKIIDRQLLLDAGERRQQMDVETELNSPVHRGSQRIWAAIGAANELKRRKRRGEAAIELQERLSSPFCARTKTHPFLSGAAPVVQRSKTRAARSIMRSDRTIGPHLPRAVATGADQRVRFVDLLNKPCPAAPHAARAFVPASGIFHLHFRRLKGLAGQGLGMSGAGAADVRELPVVPYQLLAGVRDMSAKGARKSSGGQVGEAGESGPGLRS